MSCLEGWSNLYTYIFRLSFFLFFPVELFLVGFPFGDLWWWGIAPLGGKRGRRKGPSERGEQESRVGGFWDRYIGF